MSDGEVDGPLVVDASAVLALLKGESFVRLDPERVVGARISAVNLAEVLGKLRDGGLSDDEARDAAGVLDLEVVAFDGPLAHLTAALRLRTRKLGLSLGDRACLATALAARAEVATADRTWTKADVGVRIHQVR